MFVYRYKSLGAFIYTKAGKINYIKLFISEEAENISSEIKFVFDEYFINKKDIEYADIFEMPKRYKDVYKFLKENVGFGNVISYKGLGDALKYHQRAIAVAMKLNPLPIFIPCHRVVFKGFYKDKKYIGGYNGGTHIKEFLLRHENVL